MNKSPGLWLVLIGFSGVALFFLRLSYQAQAHWSEYMALGDPSGAEIYEIEFWPESILAVTLLILSGFLAGRGQAKL